MSRAPAKQLEPRKTPVQTRSAVTVHAIAEATIQVLLERGPDRLTTTRVAARAGVSVGTLYQYFPNKQALLFAVLEDHLGRVAAAVEHASSASEQAPLSVMVEKVVTAFIDAKMLRADISLALYAVAAELDGARLVARLGSRTQRALARMLDTASDAHFEDAAFTAGMMLAAMSGTIRAVFEAGVRPKAVRRFRAELQLMCEGYLRAAARPAKECTGSGPGLAQCSQPSAAHTPDQ